MEGKSAEKMAALHSLDEATARLVGYDTHFLSAFDLLGSEEGGDPYERLLPDQQGASAEQLMHMRADARFSGILTLPGRRTCGCPRMPGGRGVLLEIVETLAACCLADKPEDSDWVVLPVANFDAYFGTTSFGRKYLKQILEIILESSEPGFGLCRYRLGPGIRRQAERL